MIARRGNPGGVAERARVAFDAANATDDGMPTVLEESTSEIAIERQQPRGAGRRQSESRAKPGLRRT